MNLFRLSTVLLLGALGAFDAPGQPAPIQQIQSSNVFNLQSLRGVPISSTLNNPPGSDGRAPDPSSGSTGTPGQYQSHAHFGAVVRTTNTLTGVINAITLDLPRGNNLVMPRARVGNPFAARTVSFLYGEMVTPPEKDEYGVDLSQPNVAQGRPTPVAPSDYWWREPFTTTEHANGGYYYSPHAEKVYASQSGAIQVVWQRTAPSTLQPGAIGGAGNVFARGANRNVQTNAYVISATPIQQPRRMYWTEGSFRDTGVPISIPAERVQDLKVVYNDRVPRIMPEVLINGTKASTIDITNTVWFDATTGNLRAYNAEGRVLLELLGDPRPDAGNGIREQIGMEIIDVFQRPPIDDLVTIDLGDPITPFQGDAPADTPDLEAAPLLTSSGVTFDFRHSIPGSSRFNYYAVRETVNENDYLAHWTEESIAGLRWPYRYVRYKFVWPADVAKYTHYVRPAAATLDEAKATAIPLPSENAPSLAYQDALDQPRGGLTANFAYYSWLTPSQPVHRALLRFTGGQNIRFERVFSWLDEVLRVSASPIASSVSTDFQLNLNTLALGNAYGGATITNGALHLNEGLFNQNAAYVVNDFNSNQVVASFRVRFKVRIGDTNLPPADGFGFSFGTIPDGTYPNYPAYLADEGTTSGVVVNFDLWDNGEVAADWAPGIVIKTNGLNHVGVAIAEPGLFDFRPDPQLLPAPRDPATGQYLALTTGNEFVPVEIVMYPGGAMDVSYRGVKVLDHVPTSFTPRKGRFGFSSRTGSVWAAHWIDDLSIEVNPGLVTANPILAGTVATNLSSWVSSNYFLWPDRSTRPFVSEATAFVGQRLTAPDGEIGGGLDTNYLAGYLRTSEGNFYLPDAYADPLVVGFDAANRGAIIPVNTMPGQDHLEVWWFRRNHVNLAAGFKTILWPSVVTRYTVRWPDNASEIVLASNDGSGPLTSLEATGSIYYENDRTRPGFNPNEEHALMQGGQVYALRDDLNITTADGYSSAPFVLLRYTAEDGRPAIRPFQVLREKPEAGLTFEYNKTAGSILQPPMPLPLLGPAFAPKLPGEPRVPLTEELVGWNVRVSDVGNRPELDAWQLILESGRHGLPQLGTFALQNLASAPPVTRYFFTTDVAADRTEGIVSTNQPFVLGPLDARTATAAQFVVSPEVFSRFAGWLNRQVVLAVSTPRILPIVGEGSGPANPGSTNSLHKVQVAQLIPAGAGATVPTIRFQFLNGLPEVDLVHATRIVAIQPASGYADNQFDGWRLSWNEALMGAPSDLLNRYSRATMNDRKGNLWVYRGPHLADRPETFAIRYYYNTLPGFYFPGVAHELQPPAGTPTPYLRSRNAAGAFLGDPIYGNADLDPASDGNALAIVYHPVWPENTPVLQMAETLMTPKRGLPAVRGQSSLEVLYQQSFVRTNLQRQPELNSSRTSVALHDPTREKVVLFDQALIPGSVKTETSRGKIYFPNLPPHLVKRFFLDPNRGPNGALVFVGEFVDAPLGDKFLLLNVAGEKDAATLRDLCLLSDPARSVWNDAIAGLATTIERFAENPARPGTYAPAASRTVNLSSLSEVRSANEAVDSYALTAVGPETGYVSLIAGNGAAFTPEGEPVSIHVIRVSPTLYRGEVNVIESENPLNERLTLQQVTDLAGKAEEYVFEWRITAPVDGQPPSIYRKTPIALPLAAWSHLRLVTPNDNVADPAAIDPERLANDVPFSGPVIPVSEFPFSRLTRTLFSTDSRFANRYVATLVPEALPHHLIRNDLIELRDDRGQTLPVWIYGFIPGQPEIDLRPDAGLSPTLEPNRIIQVAERRGAGPQSLLFSQFMEPTGSRLTDLWLGVNIGSGLEAAIYVNGGFVARVGFPTNNTTESTPASDLAAPRLAHYFRLPASVLSGGLSGATGRTNRIAVELFSGAAPGTPIDFVVRVEAYNSQDLVAAAPTVWIPLPEEQFTDGVRAVVGGSADVRSLSDNYLTMRYTPIAAQGDTNRWSQWTEPQLAEGWIKRVLKGINPFNQRITDLYNNAVNTEVSVVAQAGQRWEGDIALSLDSINNYGLIEIYETVLNRGKMLSVGGGVNYGPANDALLLAAGYINDLYNIVGNEASADASNPTIGIGTKDNTYGDIATALFAFKGQLPSLLEEELALLRGRDDFLVPGVETRPVYNRMVWNYTRGIDAGEVIYALNYNVLDQNTDGKVDADDARRLYPQGHGDAYGHYLTAGKGYYHLFLDRNFDWVPRSEAVLVLGKPVSVDYQDERKWAATSGALARTGKQIFDLTWRRDFQSGSGRGWAHLRTTRSSNKRTRHWGADHWAARTGQGAYFNWIVGNAIIPEVDPDPAHQNTIQQVDRSTVPELKELPVVAESLQTAMDQAEGGMTPLGLPEDTVPFDLNPLSIANGPFTHFEQIYTRALGALNNAVAAFDNAKDVTRLMRSEQDSLTEFRTQVEQQELAYTNSLIEIYGTPYPEDIGPGKTYRTGFVGPDTVHYMYIDNVELAFRDPYGNSLLVPSEDKTWVIDTQTFTADWLDEDGLSDFAFVQPAFDAPIDGTGQTDGYLAGTTNYVSFNLSSHGFFKKPSTWGGKRQSPGRVQQAVSDVVKARNAAFSAFYNADAAKYDLDWAIQALEKKIASHELVRGLQKDILDAETVAASAKVAFDLAAGAVERISKDAEDLADSVVEAIPKSLIVGLATGGDGAAPARSAIKATKASVKSALLWTAYGGFAVQRALEYATETANKYVEFNSIEPEEFNQELREAVSEIRDKVYGMNNQFMSINAALQELDDAQRAYRSALAEGERIQAEREIFRRRTAAVIQGYRSRDASFRIFRNEKLERYKSLFDLAAQYTYMAAKAYDYDTGLLGTARGREFISRIVNSRALGVVTDGQPQFAGSNTGDPGLSSVLAEMYGDWSVVKSRLGFNNPDAYGTTVSLRYENYRVTTNATTWLNVMNQARRDNLLDDPDVRRYCLQIDSQNGAPVPGLVFEFSTTIADGLNLLGKPLMPFDHAMSPSSFATKIYAVGVAFPGYVGMDDPTSASDAIDTSGGQSPPDPFLGFLNPDALAANPYIYMIPVGTDSMRSPALGDTGTIRTWTIQDVTIPLPFNIGGSGFSTKALWQSEDSLSEPLFNIRKHQAFRCISDPLLFEDNTIYSTGGELWRNKFTSTRLIGRSVWNSKWKIVVPARTLLSDPNEGLERFIRTVNDVRIYFQTYSYSGN